MLLNKPVLYLLTSIIFFTSLQPLYAEGIIKKINVPIADSASSDGVSWANASPIMIDNFGHYMIPIQQYGTGQYFMAYSNDKGANWTTLPLSGITFRPAMAYDTKNDLIHVLVESSTAVSYRRLRVYRDSSKKITSLTPDLNIGLDSKGACSSAYFGTYPQIIWKDDSASGILIAFWSVIKNCSGTTKTEVRSSMLTLNSSSTDTQPGSWKAPKGTPDTFGSASVPFNAFYSATGQPRTERPFIHSALIKGGPSSKKDDLYLFTLDSSIAYAFQRFSWNPSSKNWSGNTSSRTIFTGLINGSGYSNNDELITKPVLDPDKDRVYIGVGWYRNSTLRDSQTLYYVDSNDAVIEVGDVYNHRSGTFFAPTLDIMYNNADRKIYTFYQTSSANPQNTSASSGTFEGNAWYRTYDGNSFAVAQPFLTQAINGVKYTVDIPIVHRAPDNGRIILFFRADGPESPYSPPHHFFFGYLPTSATAYPTPTAQVTIQPSPTRCQPLGDMSEYPNCKGSVNSLDLAYFLSKWDSTDYKANLDNSGKVNTIDLSILISNLAASKP